MSTVLQASPRPRPASPYVVPLSPSHQDNFLVQPGSGARRGAVSPAHGKEDSVMLAAGEGVMPREGASAGSAGKKRKAEDGEDQLDVPVVDMTHLDSSPAKPQPGTSAKARNTSKQAEAHDASGSDKENQREAGGGAAAGDGTGEKTSSSSSKAKPQPKRFKIDKENNASKPVVELKKKKLVLHQEAMSLTKYEQFHSLLGQYHVYLGNQPRGAMLQSLESEFHPLVIMIGQESAAKNVKELAKVVASEMKPMAVGTDDEFQSAELSSKALIDLLPRVFEHTNYGFHPSDFSHFPIVAAEGSSAKAPTHGAAEVKLPAGLTIWRWEAKELDLIPNPEGEGGFKGRDAMQTRRAIREQAREECRRNAAHMDNITASALLSIPFGPATTPSNPKAATASPAPAGPAIGDVVMGEPDSPAAAEAAGSSRDTSPAQKEAPQKAEKQPKKVKEETEEQKARRLAKERKQEEAARKESEKAKAAKMMQGFFKPKPPANAHASTSTAHHRQRSQSRESRESSVSPSDFAMTFLPFQALKHVDLAPVDPFKRARAAGPKTPVVTHWATRDFVGDIVDRATRRHTLTRPMRAGRGNAQDSSQAGKTPALYATVTQLVARAQEVADPREVYDNLKDLTKFPRKVLKFAEDLRPPYVGTWSRPSANVGPRSPFAMDPFLDYSIDEGVDWEEDNPEEDINEQADEESDEDSEDNSIMGDWMVPDDEIEFEDDVELSPGKVRPDVPMSDTFAMEDKAARAKAATEAAIAKRKVDKLVPFVKGPIWESKYSLAAWEGFEAYKITFLNDTPGAGIDPFLWQATPLEPITSSASVIPPTSTELGKLAPPDTAASQKEALTPAIKEKKEKKEKPRPKGDFPPDRLVAFLEHIKSSDKPKGQLLPELHAKFKGNPSQALMTWVFEDVAVRPTIKGGLWTVKEEAWVRAHVSPSDSHQPAP